MNPLTRFAQQSPEAVQILFAWTSTRAEAVRDKANEVKARHSELKLFIAALQHRHPDPETDGQFVEFTLIGSDFEAAATAISGDLLIVAREAAAKGLTFSDVGKRDILDLADFFSGSIELALSVLERHDLGAAQNLLERKARLRGMERQLQNRHMRRLADRIPDSVATSSLHQDALRSIKQINSCFAIVATTLLERSGRLSDTRVVAE